MSTNTDDTVVAYSTRSMPLAVLTRLREIAVLEDRSAESVLADVLEAGLAVYAVTPAHGFGENER